MKITLRVNGAEQSLGWDSATVRVHPTGSVTVLTGISPHGQGQGTAFAQIAADSGAPYRANLARVLCRRAALAAISRARGSGS